MTTIHHPYIGGGGGRIEGMELTYDKLLYADNGEYFMNTCLGDLGKAIQRALYEMNFDEFLIALNLWRSTYNYPHTGPLNNLRNSFTGKPTSFIEDTDDLSTFYNIVGRRNENAEDCDIYRSLRNSGWMHNSTTDKPEVINYCENIKCEFINSCDARPILIQELDDEGREKAGMYALIYDQLYITWAMIDKNLKELSLQELKAKYEDMKAKSDEWEDTIYVWDEYNKRVPCTIQQFMLSEDAYTNYIVELNKLLDGKEEPLTEEEVMMKIVRQNQSVINIGSNPSRTPGRFAQVNT